MLGSNSTSPSTPFKSKSFTRTRTAYKWRPGQPSIAIGDFLGDMSDELDGDVITDFVSGGAKNYGYQTRAGKVVCKVRGFALNVRGSAILKKHMHLCGLISYTALATSLFRHVLFSP